MDILKLTTIEPQQNLVQRLKHMIRTKHDYNPQNSMNSEMLNLSAMEDFKIRKEIEKIEKEYFTKTNTMEGIRGDKNEVYT